MLSQNADAIVKIAKILRSLLKAKYTELDANQLQAIILV